MIDCFIRTTGNATRLRAAMFQVTRERWRLENVNISHFWDRTPWESRTRAEQMATTDPYILTDDDVLLVGKDWVKRAVKAMYNNPQYAICSTLSLVEGENLAKGDGEIYEMHAVGAPMLIRKGILRDLPPMDLNSECGVLHKYVLDRGYKEGLISGLRHNHMGHGFSSNPALFWGY